MANVCKRPVWSLVLCGALLGACSESQPNPGQSAGAGAGGQVAGTGGAGAAGSAGAGAGRGGSAAGASGRAANGGSGGAPASAELERSVVAADDTPDISDADYAAFRQHFAAFGVDLGQKVASAEKLTTENLVYSPLSAAYALAMTYGGARGETAAEMKAALGDSFEAGTYHSGANRLGRELATRATSTTDADGKTRKVELDLAAALFLERTRQVEPAFLDLLASEYDSGVRRLDFAGAHEAARVSINDWVADKTRDKILDLLPMGSVTAETPFVLVNALYFYGSWLTPFPHGGTSPADFHTLGGETVQVDTMRAARLTTGYASTADYSLAELRYLNDDLQMIVVLPAQDKFESVRGGATAAWLDQAVSTLEPALLDVSLPKVELTVGSFSLKAGLEALGMKQAFTNGADFSGVAAGIKLEDVVQKAFIAVDEDGTEAAAATGVIAGPTSAPVDQPIPFKVDRPYLFFIRDANGIVLFSGHIVDPSQGS